MVQAVRRETFSEAQGELRKLLLLGIHTFDELAKPLFFVAYSRLCHHCRDFILRSVATFWVMPLAGIYRGRGLIIRKKLMFFHNSSKYSEKSTLPAECHLCILGIRLGGILTDIP